MIAATGFPPAPALVGAGIAALAFGLVTALFAPGLFCWLVIGGALLGAAFVLAVTPPQRLPPGSSSRVARWR